MRLHIVQFPLCARLKANLRDIDYGLLLLLLLLLQQSSETNERRSKEKFPKIS